MAEAGGSGHDKLLLPSTTILYTLAKKLGTLVFRHTYQMYKNLEKGSKIAMDYWAEGTTAWPKQNHDKSYRVIKKTNGRVGLDLSSAQYFIIMDYFVKQSPKLHENCDVAVLSQQK